MPLPAGSTAATSLSPQLPQLPPLQQSPPSLQQQRAMTSSPASVSTPTAPTAPPTAPVVEISDTLDPLSHLSHIFEKIRKQVIEWGEDANWKIDVFLLPNEDGTPNSGTSNSAPPSATTRSAPHDTAPRRIEPRANSPSQIIEIDSDNGKYRSSPHFALQPPPSDLPPLIAGEGVPTSLTEQDIEKMTESEAKQTLSLAIRQIRVHQDSLAQAIQDLESVQRVSAEKERDAEARLDVEKTLMERDAAVLSRKWKDAENVLMEKEREIRDVQKQLEERRKVSPCEREQGANAHPLPGQEGLGLIPPEKPSMKVESSPPQQHNHGHRHVHRHRHHHQYLYKHPDMGKDSLGDLALLATQVLMKEPLIISKKPIIKSESNAQNVYYPTRSDKKRSAAEDMDQGLQLRPVKRIDAYGLDSDQSKYADLSASKQHIDSKLVTNGKMKTEAHGRLQSHRSAQVPTNQQKDSGSPTVTKSSPVDQKDSSKSLTKKSII
ncbi:hypothetical protein BGZ76_001943 [Entomortierella beljakovae]|nr:hypothetical protein BGZ76_001943 [Entomortierella beljakovae]